MELKNLFIIFKKNWLWLVLPIILVPILSLIFSHYMKPKNLASFSLTFVPVRQNIQANAAYSEDLKSANLFAISAGAWLKDQALVSEILQNAGIDSKNYTSDQLQSLFNITLLDNSFTLTAQVQGADKNQAQKLAEAAIVLVKQETNGFNQNTKNGIKFTVQDSIPYISAEKTPLNINLLLGLLAGIALGLIFSLSKYYIES